MNTLVKIFIIILVCILTLPLVLLATSEVPDWAISVPEKDKSQLIKERVVEKQEEYFIKRIAFVILRDLVERKVDQITGKAEQNEQNEIENKLADANKHLRNALEITTQQIHSKTDAQSIVSNIIIGATPLGALSEIYESVDDANAIIKANREIENALLILQSVDPFDAQTVQTKDSKPYKFEADLIAMQAAQYFKYKNNPSLMKYFLEWETNFNVGYDEQFVSYELRNYIESGREPGLLDAKIKGKCPYSPREKEDSEYCYGFVAELGTYGHVDEFRRFKPMPVRIIQLEQGRDIYRGYLSISADFFLGKLEYSRIGFSQKSLFEPVLGELSGQEVKEILEMKKYIESKPVDEIPAIKQRIVNMQKKLYVSWEPYTIPEQKMDSIFDEFSRLQEEAGLFGVALEFNESKIRKNSSGEYIYIDEIERIQEFSVLLNITPTIQDFEKYYNDYSNRLLTIKKDLDALESKYSSGFFTVSKKIINFYSRFNPNIIEW